MRKMIKRSLAAVMAVASLAVGVVGMNASAYSNSVYFMKDAGSPSGSGTTSAVWNYKANIDTSTITVKNFTREDKTSYIFAYISYAGVSTSGSITPTGGSVSKGGIVPGANMYASAKLSNYESGNIRADVSISG
ncbi:MAG: hypothetical protein NC177_17845 [Ruminococcus flavefaciens]|nr:hypothetical protein [Ruminococcus flavefaciens]